MRQPLRIATGGILHETHTFAPGVTDLEAFEQIGINRGQEILQHKGAQSAIGGILDSLEGNGCQIMPLLYASATPSGTVSAQAYQQLLTRFLEALENAIPVDGVVLSLHGAMVAKNQVDCEGEILEKVRALVGAECPVVAVLDMHGNVSPRMVENADALVAFNENPHLDARERGIEAVDILIRILSERVRQDRFKLTSALVHPRLLLSALATWTRQKPLAEVHVAARKYKKDSRVINISVMGGYAYADTPFSGVSVVVTTVGNRPLAKKIAEDLAQVAWDYREAALSQGLSPEEAVREALASTHKPVVLADVGDNVGGGSPGDGTVLLKALLDVNAQGAVVVIADGEVAAQAHAMGEGGVLQANLGGKQDGWHGEPVSIQGVIEKITDGKYVRLGKDHFANLYGVSGNMGLTAVIRCAGVRILVTSRKTPPGELNQLRSQGIEPTQQNILVVKSAVAFRGAYGPIAGKIIEVNTPGLCSSDLSRFDYQQIPRPIYPLDAIP